MICPECNGSGEAVYYIETDRDENSVTIVPRKGICRTCNGSGKKLMTNADRIRSMSDEELAEFLTHINPTNCQDCAFSHGWRCQPNRDDYSDFEKCEEGRKRWLQQPAEENKNGV